MKTDQWIDVGGEQELSQTELQTVPVGSAHLALSFGNGRFGAVSNKCNHLGGPLGQGRLDGDYVVCPWHYWKFHRVTGLGEPGYEKDAVPAHEVKVEQGRVLINKEPFAKRSHLPHPPHELAREPVRAQGPVRVLGLSTTIMTADQPRYSTSEDLLDTALKHASDHLACETRLLRVRDLSFRACEGFYSKSARACTWPCSITQMDANDQMERVYEGLVHWADVILVATPIRWGAASSLYYKMVERLNCVQNHLTLHDKRLMNNKVAGFIITGGQDGVQAVAGQMLGFFAEVGCQFPSFPYIAHTRGWSAEDMENNMRQVQSSTLLHEAATALVTRCTDTAKLLLAGALDDCPQSHGGRKGNADHHAHR
jgi:nitrite reductase/ring-hydroxylating ferredoxin subunit/multimeric flavodoxin WrbA